MVGGGEGSGGEVSELELEGRLIVLQEQDPGED